MGVGEPDKPAHKSICDILSLESGKSEKGIRLHSKRERERERR